MIVVDQPDGSLLLVRQRDHAAASGLIAQAWRRPTPVAPDTWDRLIEAVRRHDDGWSAAEQSPLLDPDGRPFDFKSIPTPQHVALWRRSIDLAAQDDPYVALLIAQHARWLYTTVGQDGIEDQRTAQQFADETAARIDGFIEQLSTGSQAERAAVSPRVLATARALVAFFDALSLALVGGLPPLQQSEVLPFGDASAALKIDHQGEQVRIDPWPFRTGAWHLETRAIELANTRFTGAGELVRQIEAQTPTRLSWRIEPVPN